MFAFFQTSIKKELIAGLSTFAAMSYIFIINASILSETGMDEGAVMVATIIMTAIASIIMGLISNFPIALAPALSISPFLAYTVVLQYGYSWQQAMGGLFFSSLFLLILNLLNIRQKVALSIPLTLRHATISGIGLFLMLIGLKHVKIIQTEGLFISLDTVFSLTSLFTALAVVIIFLFLKFKISSGYILTMLFCWITALFFDLVPYSGIVGPIPSISPILFKLDVSLLGSLSYWSIIFSFFLIALIDTGAALMSLCYLTGLCEKDKMPDLQPSLFCDSSTSIFGSMVGSGSLTFHLESFAGIQAGGKTGLTSIITGLCFLSCLFFFPLVKTIPDFASASVIIVIGYLMFKQSFKIHWKDSRELIPSLLLIVSMGVTLSLYNGLSMGFLSYAFLRLLTNKTKDINPIFWILCLIIALHHFFLIF